MGEMRLRLRFADYMDNVLGYYLLTHFRQEVIVQRFTTPRGCFRFEAESTFINSYRASSPDPTDLKAEVSNSIILVQYPVGQMSSRIGLMSSC